MSSDVDALGSNRMTDGEVNELLSRVGVGVLSLARDGEAYGVPVSFGFDGEETLYFVFVGYGAESRKEAFAAETARASFTAFEVTDRDRWRSVVVGGRLESVDREEWTSATEAIEANAWYPSLFRTADPTGGLEIWALRIDERSGLHGGAGS
jgi:hypothetical protein